MKAVDRSGDELVEVRLLVPRRELAAPAPRVDPELVSQESSLAIFGLPPRRFLEIVRSPRFTCRVLRIGKLRLVRRDELLAHLETIDEGPAELDAPAAEPPRLAARLGLEEVPAAHQRRGGRHG